MKEKGLGIFSILTIIFIILKLTKVIKWSWVWVFAPMWIWLIIAILIFALLGFIHNLINAK